MAEHDTKPPEHKPAPRASTTTTEPKPEKKPESKEELVEAGYIGIDPIYANVSETEPHGEPTSGTGDLKGDEKDAAEAELEMIEKVAANEVGCVVEIDEVTPFEDWVAGTDAANRKATISGIDQERVEADAEKTEEAKGDDGKIAPRSTSGGQPGIYDATS